ncbi:MAG: carboxypeptidase-like regulatory domain-containing protein [Paludibaculum sp.]
MRIHSKLGLCAPVLAFVFPIIAAEQRGVVKFNGLPVPGASVTAKSDRQSAATVTGSDGAYQFTELPPGEYQFKVEMPGFATLNAAVSVSESNGPRDWNLEMLTLSAMSTQGAPASPAAPVLVPGQDRGTKGKAVQGSPTTTQTTFQRTELGAAAEPGSAIQAPKSVSGAFEHADAEELSRRAVDGFLVNGSTNNGASSQFGQAPSFGNQRRGPGSQYNANLGVTLGNAALDARPYSLTGQNTPKPGYSRTQAMLSFGGPLKIPHLLRRNGPNLTVNYQWLRSSTVTAQSGVVPTAAERSGDLSLLNRPFYDPWTRTPFPGQRIPSSRISPQAEALLLLYPLPNFQSASRSNYQVPLAVETHDDNLQTRFQQRLAQRNQLFGSFAYANTRTDNPSLLGFLDRNKTTGINAAINWVYAFSQSFRVVVGAQYSRLDSRAQPYFAGRRNISGEAGIEGNDQSPENWGPPSLAFSSGLAGLTDVQSSLSRNRTSGASVDFSRSRGNHSLAFGGLWRKQQFNLLTQENPRGLFAFTGAATQGGANDSGVSGTGSDLAGFLLGVPDTIAIARGNPDKYFRAPAAALFVSDDWRLNPDSH